MLLRVVLLAFTRSSSVYILVNDAPCFALIALRNAEDCLDRGATFGRKVVRAAAADDTYLSEQSVPVLL